MFTYEALLELKEYKDIQNIIFFLSAENIYINEYLLMDKWFNKNIRIKFLLNTPIQEEEILKKYL